MELYSLIHYADAALNASSCAFAYDTIVSSWQPLKAYDMLFQRGRCKTLGTLNQPRATCHLNKVLFIRNIVLSPTAFQLAGYTSKQVLIAPLVFAGDSSNTSCKCSKKSSS